MAHPHERAGTLTDGCGAGTASPLESEIRSTYVMSLSDGLPISVTVTQETGRAGDSAHRIETTTWERQEEGAP